jgi:hypothetical protein
MTSVREREALAKFDRENVGFSKGALSVVLTVTHKARGMSFPLKPDSFLTPSGGQVSGTGGPSVSKILQRYNISRKLSAEGGRTSRGSIERMRLYVALLNKLEEEGGVDLQAAEQFWVGRVQNYFDSMPFTFRLDPSKSLRACIRNLLDQTVERQREASGTRYAGAVMQHLVGAKLRIVSPGATVTHSVATADAPTNRSADFTLDDAAIHVTTAPSHALLSKCNDNLGIGLKPIIVTTEDGVGGARAIARQLGIEDRVDVIEIEQFLAANVYERSGFRKENRAEFLKSLIGSYNEIVAEAETDPSLRIEFQT